MLRCYGSGAQERQGQPATLCNLCFPNLDQFSDAGNFWSFTAVLIYLAQGNP